MKGKLIVIPAFLSATILSSPIFAVDSKAVPQNFKMSEGLRQQLLKDPEAALGSSNFISVTYDLTLIGKTTRSVVSSENGFLVTHSMILDKPVSNLFAYHGFATLDSRGELLSLDYSAQGVDGDFPPQKFTFAQRSKDYSGGEVRSLYQCVRGAARKAADFYSALPGKIFRIDCSSGTQSDSFKSAMKFAFYYSDYLDFSVGMMYDSYVSQGEVTQAVLRFKDKLGVEREVSYKYEYKYLF
ncbi:hypothetical protein [Pseudomonas putida]|nr:hypothetical protein [Pseudomonas putida]